MIRRWLLPVCEIMELYSHEIQKWIDKETTKRTLIICGEGGLEQRWQKQSLLHLGNTFSSTAWILWKRFCLYTGQEALLTMWPSQHFTDSTVDESDEVKSFLDVKCRHEDGYIPANTRRIFLRNHDKQWHTYLLSEGGRERQPFKSHHKTHALGQCHWEAIQGWRIWNPGERTSWWCCVEEAVCSRESRPRRSGSHTDNFELEKDFLTYIKLMLYSIINPKYPLVN